MLPASLLGVVFGNLAMRHVVTVCWLVCKSWRQRMHVSTLYLDGIHQVQLLAVEPRCIVDLCVSASVGVAVLNKLTNVVSLRILEDGPSELLTCIHCLWPGLRTLCMTWLHALTSLDWDLPELRELDLSWTNLSGADLEPLARMPCLAKLNLYDTHLSSAATRVLARVPSLTSLGLGANMLTDSDVCALQALIGLRALNLSGTRITDTSVEYLSTLPQLEQLALSSSHVRRPALDVLSKLKAVYLSLCRLEVLRLPPGLEKLDLAGAQVLALSVPPLNTLKTLDVTDATLEWEVLDAPDLECIRVASKDRDRAARRYPHAVVKVLT
jgi:hypothetical protein